MNYFHNLSEYKNYFIRKFNRYCRQSNTYLGTDRIPVNQIVSPLRYDIVARYKFFKFYGNNIDLFQTDFDQFFQLVLSSEYFIWYKHIAYTLEKSLFGGHPDLYTSFKERVLKSVALFDSYQNYGFDKSNPIVLHSGKNIKTTTSGIKLPTKYYAGDGCHRIALLWFSGSKYLEPDQYVVREFKSFKPLDNTSLLLPHLAMTESEYLSYICSRFTTTKFENIEKSILNLEARASSG